MTHGGLTLSLGCLVAAAGLSLAAVAGAGCTTTTTIQGYPPGADAGPTDDDGGLTEGGPEKPPPQPEKPGCAQSAYTEALPSKTSIADLTYSSAQPQTYVLSALGRRYPVGKFVLEGGIASPLSQTQGNCVDRFLSDKSTSQSVLRQASTLVHECGHFFDIGESTGASDSAYVLRPDLRFTCKGGDTTSRGGKTFARSRIKTDSFYASREACGGSFSAGCDSYADIYLDGDPDDATFTSGDQGYNFVLEEALQYVNSLATALTFQEAYQGTKQSERDGILTFLWYIERYMQMARTKYPAAYTALSTDPCWRQATLSVWDRAWFYLDATKGLSALEIDASAIEGLVKEPSLIAEIDALRALECQ